MTWAAWVPVVLYFQEVLDVGHQEPLVQLPVETDPARLAQHEGMQGNVGCQKAAVVVACYQARTANVNVCSRVARVVTKMKMAGDVRRAEWKEKMCRKMAGETMTRDCGRGLRCLLWTMRTYSSWRALVIGKVAFMKQQLRELFHNTAKYQIYLKLFEGNHICCRVQIVHIEEITTEVQNRKLSNSDSGPDRPSLKLSTRLLVLAPRCNDSRRRLATQDSPRKVSQISEVKERMLARVTKSDLVPTRQFSDPGQSNN
ncbi:hypothetical protein EV702DRAFT_1044866 [Suillus placidus]|uniref:Uncharacterized protein n=1 Tax=Suillus placidus TaxID=48579 RepID=A0A9P7D3W5_9AGAM|nr:hypothetical protein EV702DRAFT_1044866 [Suillus placidus]